MRRGKIRLPAPLCTASDDVGMVIAATKKIAMNANRRVLRLLSRVILFFSKLFWVFKKIIGTHNLIPLNIVEAAVTSGVS